MTDSDSGALDRRITALEDRLAIYELVAAYGPAADAGQADAVADIWTDDGVYEIPGFEIDAGRIGVRDLICSDFHQELIARGAAHVLSMPTVQLEDDHAVATGYAQVIVADGDGFRVYRTVATRWEFRREAHGWRCSHRSNQLLDGRPEARALLSQAAQPRR